MNAKVEEAMADFEAAPPIEKAIMVAFYNLEVVLRSKKPLEMRRDAVLMTLELLVKNVETETLVRLVKGSQEDREDFARSTAEWMSTRKSHIQKLMNIIEAL